MVTLGEAAELISASEVKAFRAGNLWRYLQVMNVNLGRSELLEGTTDGGTQNWYGPFDDVIDFQIKATTPEIRDMLTQNELQDGLASSATWELIYPSVTGGDTTMTVQAHLAKGIEINSDGEEVMFTGSLRITVDPTSASVS